ncbi:8-oxo-dGTP pyrophosphatase MutT, NUDIX family [Noviherbaspirillum humi]|uniref:8-oxo-dGTP pyrophosphatase MutT, NUDIX family n=1 Tax=Noviherbaspirillum humi TaxID=1688639 RepID=A0A239M4T6_9BURK|nr:NUDIX hydrolase [Noviherbaspirillum humi]SNT37705.1 8-oxo-dGTP pyrophosphatase MutT, NUDIX family [Noviherbaspirillum humi]
MKNHAQGSPARRARPKMLSCGTLVISTTGKLLLCHATGTGYWDIPKGLRDPGESSLEAAMRELREETGLVFDSEMFEEIGCFDYRPDKQLHLFRVHAPAELDSLGHLICTSHFTHHVTGVSTPEMDGFCWASRQEISRLCWPRMAQRLLALDW